MNYPKEILVENYFDIHNYYTNIYGKDRTIILMQVGSFHEAYCTDNDGLNLVELAQELDICCTQKNKFIPLTKKNPRMMGFPTGTTYNFIDKLIDLNYTIVLIDQTSEPVFPKKMFERKVTNIFSPATHIDKKTNKSNFLLSIVLDKIKDKVDNYQFYIGLSTYDLSTGFGYFYETYSTSNDERIGLDDALRFIENFPPREIVFQNNLKSTDTIGSMSVDDILSYLEIKKDNVYTIPITKHNKLSYQRDLFNRIFKIESNIDIIEIIGLEYLNLSRLSLTLLLDYVLSHQPILLEQLRIPTLFSSNKYLYLGNRALEQLDILTKNNNLNLLNIINYTKTSIGKRFLTSQLSNPLIDHNEINKRYEIIGKILENDHSVKIVNYLEDIYDLDKLIRKLEINTINPIELYQLYISFYQIIKLTNYLNEVSLLDIFDINEKDINLTNNFNSYIENTFVISKINEQSFNNFFECDYSFYNIKIHEEIDQLQEKINSTTNFMDYLIKALEIYIDEKTHFKKSDSDQDSKSLITLKFNERDGHYLLITNRRCELMKNNMKQKKITKLNIGSIELNIDELKYEPLPKSSNTKISCQKVKDLSSNLVVCKQEMAKKLKEIFKMDMKLINEKYGKLFHNWSNKIAFIDFINSGAICSKENHYCKPKINIKEFSYFKAKELRHPIVEKINTNFSYVPHNIELGESTDQNGILLYGINSSGKSTLMKSIGINIILAQIGYYTASTSFEYSPYYTLFTRICGNDNMFRGQSSFQVEMMELMSILKRNNSNTLIIGDEICRGTEEKSANIIVCYMLELLAKSNTSFITATHLHKLAKMESVKNINSVKAKHLKITYDQINETLIYDRHLSDGQGESFYGLQVAKFLMKDKLFNERTTEICMEYDNIIKDKSSKYNSDVYLHECEICKIKDKLESHHIKWQKDFNSDKIHKDDFGLQKDDASNLVVLCQGCHDKVDRDQIKVYGWLETSNGRKLDYKFNSIIIKKNKYTQELIDYIYELKSIVNGDLKMAVIKVKEEFNTKVSSKSILKFWTKN
jgi:DNA mismatch repair protein MutS